ncbi:mechanosensitive ion channel family protein [Desulfurivibrio dismutans]|uniref:mechanosensitive ion channel family protein n=1 Tax=Desulfurivibrio dismutans TaxID=1398908 RepID=UPI0023DCDF87|nr:mechanosensitive ion channel family protein [Desulfurivibrio alkaliphilus]MDF1613880.1 mechanosensitive ion channel family protein [Desulfurivibrio alkaliphilus]
MDIFGQYLQEISWDEIILTSLRIMLILLAAWGLMLFVRKTLARLEERLLEEGKKEGEPPSEAAKRVETLIRLIRQAALIMVNITAALIVLREMGVDIAPILAGAGIVGLAVGFGAQNLVRDIIAGFFFILENQLRVGDVAVVNGTGGLVEKINFRTLVLRDLGGVVHVFPNGTVTTLSNMTNEWSAYIFDIGVAYKENTDRVIEVMKKVGDELRADPEHGPLILEDLEVFGVDKFADSAVVIKGRIKTRPIRQWMVGREYLRRLKLAFDQHKIEIPFPHRTLYFGEASKPVNLQLLSPNFNLTPTTTSNPTDQQ